MSQFEVNFLNDEFAEDREFLYLMADDFAHAEEQALNAYPNCIIKEIIKLD